MSCGHCRPWLKTSIPGPKCTAAIPIIPALAKVCAFTEPHESRTAQNIGQSPSLQKIKLARYKPVVPKAFGGC